MVNLQLMLAGEKEISTIQVLAHRIWKSHYPSVIGMEQVEYMLGRFYSRESMLDQMQQGQQFYLVYPGLGAHELIDPIGFVSISEAGGGQYFIHKFYIDQELHRRGVGTAVFSELLTIYGGSIQQLRLQVNRQNFKPINFYFKLGFVIERVADFDIGDGYFMNDFVMVWHAK